jgi:hypothetical protein
MYEFVKYVLISKNNNNNDKTRIIVIRGNAIYEPKNSTYLLTLRGCPISIFKFDLKDINFEV